MQAKNYQQHPARVMTLAEMGQVRVCREQGLTYDTIAYVFRTSKEHVMAICTGQTASQRLVVGVNAKGLPVGQYHHKAKLTDEEVDRIRDLYEEGFLGYGALAKAFNVAKKTIHDIVTYRRRSTRAERAKVVRIP